MKTLTDICYSTEHNQYLDIHLPDCDAFPVFVYFHGGGITSGDKTDQKVMFEYLTAHKIAVVSANYKMYPDAIYPDFVVDAAKAVDWVFKNIAQYGKIKGIFVGGSSAGGYLSQMLCFDKRWLSAHSISPMDIAGFIHDAGQPTCHFNVLKEKGLDSRRVIIDETAPLYHVGIDEEYPPMLIIVSDNDMKNRYEQTQLLVSTLNHFGHNEKVSTKLMHGKHCAYVSAVDENSESVFGKIITNFIEANLQ